MIRLARFRWSHATIYTRLIVFFTLILLFQGALSIISLHIFISKSNMDSLKNQMHESLYGSRRYIKRQLSDLQVNAELFSRQKKIIDYTEFGLYNLLNDELQILHTSLELDAISIFISPANNVVTIGPDFTGIPEFADQLEMAFSGSEPSLVISNGTQLHMCVFKPISRNGSTIGILVLGKEIDKDFLSILENITTSNTVITKDDLIVNATSLSEEKIASLMKKNVPGENSSNHYFTFSHYLIGVLQPSALSNFSGTIAIIKDFSDSLRMIQLYTTSSIVVTVFLFILILFVGIHFYNTTFAKPIAQIQNGINQIATGDFTPPFTEGGKNEFARVTQAFNQMCRDLQRRDYELERLANFNSLILTNIPSGVLTVDHSLLVTSVNPKAQELLNLHNIDVVGQSLETLKIDSQLKDAIYDGIYHKRFLFADRITIQTDEQIILSVTTASLLTKAKKEVGVMLIMRDITPLVLMEEKVERSSRLAALGEMAAGVAHQIKNPLTVLRVSMEMLQEDYQVTDNQSEYDQLIQFIIDEIDSLDLTVLNFLDFARPKGKELQLISTTSILEYCIKHVPWEKYPQINFERYFDTQLPKIRGDRNLLIQAITNIIINALQAFDSMDEDLKEEHESRVFLKADDEDEYVVIRIGDNGQGMDAEAKNKIFNPFFSTKNGGNGLGLSIVHRIIEDHGGTIEVESTPGVGTLFTVKLEAVS